MKNVKRDAKMMLVVDIGNTNINFGLFRGKKLESRFIIPAQDYSRNELKERAGGIKIDNAVVCSVVPKATAAVAGDLRILSGKRPLVIGEDLIVPVKNLYRTPELVGQDRLVNAYAGIILYGTPLIVVDFGTAVTFDVVSKKGEYLGGMILPGLRISLDALVCKTALLPDIQLGKPREFIGRDTRNSMLSGLVYGFAALTDDLAGRIKRDIGAGARVVVTGGDAAFLSAYCDTAIALDKDLTLKGLYLLGSRPL
ncbi:MAG: type III pantothenate kinase [Candidatus Omnitrophica bacterium]|nr:type III pantothenate kinase [Candidatus Omnitrophota bacterium]